MTTQRISHRCPRMREHARPNPSCACHPHLPVPCGECYSLLVTVERIPYEPDRVLGGAA